MLLDWWRSTPSRKEAPALWRVTRGQVAVGLVAVVFALPWMMFVLEAPRGWLAGSIGEVVELFLLAVGGQIPMLVFVGWIIVTASAVKRALRRCNGLACPGCLYDLRKIAHNTADHCPECNCDLRRWPVPDSWPHEVGGGKRKL